MAKIKTRVIDRNRFTKKYPLIRHQKRPTFQGDADLVIEILTVSFNNESEKIFSFETAYPDTDFRILVSPRDTTSGDSAQVSLAIDEASTTGGGSKILASAAFTGVVDVIVIRIG